MYLLKDLIYTLQPHKKNSKQTLKDTSSTIDLIGGFSWRVAVRYIGEAEAERKGGLYRGTLFRHYIYKVWDAGLGVMFRAFRMRDGGFSWG